LLRKLIFDVGIRHRTPRLFTNLRFLLESQHWSRERLEAHQLEKLKALVAMAYEETPYYREKLQAAGVRPEDIQTLADIKKLPATSKQEMWDNTERIQRKDHPERLFFSETSGSTGKPLVFYRNMDWDAWHRASILRGYSWYGVEYWEPNGYFWGYNIAPNRRWKTKLFDRLLNRFRLFSYDDDAIAAFVKRLEGATYLGGYSSMIYEVAKRINAAGLPPQRHLKMVKGTSEKIYERYQEEAVRAFGRRIISEYGSAEAGILAFECPHGNMHITMETVILEEEDDEVIATNLVSSSFPVIRYKLGDYIVLDHTTECPCGMRHPIVREVLGRVGRLIHGVARQYPSLTLYYVFKNLAMDHGVVLLYQAVQKEKGVLEIHVDAALNDEERRLLDIELVKYFGDDMTTRVVEQVDLRSENTKKTDFISELEV